MGYVRSRAEEEDHTGVQSVYVSQSEVVKPYTSACGKRTLAP